MKKFIVENDFWNLFPKAKIGVVVCKGIDNTIKNEEKFKKMILEAEKKALECLKNPEFSSNEVIRIWRETFRKFKTKKGARSSIESLLKRVYKGNHLNNINPLVDIYNSISLKYLLPCGGEDIDKISGDIILTKAVGDEFFVALGEDKNEPPYEGELIYKDNNGAICRCLNWRESVRTMLTENTKNAVLCMELVDENRGKEFEIALEELSKKVMENLGGACKVSILDINNKEIILD
ncbi:B3/4 domain-containing protein [Marinitoga sp. 38H-ov]|uniref:B3/B4 domain-containing protein n=1 Tax=Marinitoga sp. 38H-ov TaxID=1755814 RepID=UPI0013EDAFBA|nr:B3/4 domain-containing protein [Marinitoga sp. 38H-ov]KAF2955370.1 hypothetical protein AS160_10690 [Marinitoga sp. 38H-ov]